MNAKASSWRMRRQGRMHANGTDFPCREHSAVRVHHHRFGVVVPSSLRYAVASGEWVIQIRLDDLFRGFR